MDLWAADNAQEISDGYSTRMADDWNLGGEILLAKGWKTKDDWFKTLQLSYRSSEIKEAWDALPSETKKEYEVKADALDVENAQERREHTIGYVAAAQAPHTPLTPS